MRVPIEIVQHLSFLPDATVEVTMEIQADISNGAPDAVMRIVAENCRALKFITQEVEKK
jgi:hypothetical protein